MRWIMILCLLAGCSGYRFTQQENPLSQYGIHSLSIPMFYNQSNLPNASADFTRETYRLLTGFSSLKLISGYSESSDAVLFGIIKTREKSFETQRPTNFRSAKNQAPASIGSRQDFYVPGTTQMSLTLQVVIIKKPTEEEIALLRSGLGDKILANSKIIFNDSFPLSAQYTREMLDREGTQIIATQNAGIQRKTIKGLAESAAVSIRDLIFYAF